MTRGWPSFAVALAVSACVACARPASDAAATPGYVTAVDQAPVTSSLPTTEPDQWLLAHLDVETTGLPQLSRIMSRVETIQGITSVARVGEEHPAQTPHTKVKPG